MDSRAWGTVVLLVVLLGCVLLQQTSAQEDEPVYRTINICFLIDSITNSFVLSLGYPTPDAYFDALTYVVNLLLLDLDPNLTLRSFGVQVLPSQLLLYQFNGMDFSETCLSNADTGLWKTTGLWLSYKAAGCDVGFYASAYDYLFGLYDVNGITSALQSCGESSHGIIKLYQSGANSAVIMSHELGHLLGVYHDGSMQDRYVNLYSLFPDEVSHLFFACEMSTSSECNDEVGVCIMDAAPGTQLGYPTHVSNCSRVYYEMFLEMARIYPDFYDTSCFLVYPEK